MRNKPGPKRADQRSPPGFDEAAYLAANPDVAAAVKAGTLASGLAHYQRYGANENRALRPGVRAVPFGFPFQDGQIPQRRDKILAGLDLPALQGVEIGALTAPLVTRAEGNILYVDHADTPTLRESYRVHDSVDVSRIVEVDAVWGENTLQACIGAGRTVDYVVASHVIEHTPDLVTWLAEVGAILRPGGTLRLAVPDRRYTFDWLRFETRVHDVLDAYLRRARTPLPRLIIEHHSLLRHVDVREAWDGTLDRDRLPHYNTVLNGLELAGDALRNGTYHDVHCWVFTPLSFTDLCLELASIDLLEFACLYCIGTARYDAEFFVCMTAGASKAATIASWRHARELMLRPAG